MKIKPILFLSALAATAMAHAQAVPGGSLVILRDGAIVQIGTPDEVVGAPADAYVKDFTSEVPKSHVLTLKWVMRPPDDGLADTCRVVQQDQIVRDAAKTVLDAPCCCRVVDPSSPH